MPTSTADLAELLSIEAVEAREAWEEALTLEQEGCRLDPIHWPLAAVLLLGLLPMGVRDLGRALLHEHGQHSTTPITESTQLRLEPESRC